MLIVLGILIAISALGVVLSGLLTLLSNPKKAQNRWFFALSGAVSLWIPFNFIDSNITRPVLTSVFLQLDFIAALFIAWALMEFVETLSARNRRRFRVALYRKLTFSLNVIISAAIALGLVFTSSIQNGDFKVNYQPLFAVYVAILLLYFIYSFGRLAYERSKATQANKAALNLIAVGLTIAVGANLLTNLVFPLLIRDRTTVQELNILGYVGLATFVLLIYIAITTRKLFDIRPVVTRSLAYVLSLFVSGVLFILGTFALSSLVFSDDTSIDVLRWVYAVLAVLLAFIFAPLKRFFDMLTKSIFYQDGYATQELLDQFNKVLVSTFELSELLKKSSEIIESYLQPAYCVFYVRSTAHTASRVIGTDVDVTFREADLTAFSDLALRYKQKVIVIEELGDKHDNMRKIMQANKFVVAARLATSNNDQGVGYVMLGAKKNGSLFRRKMSKQSKSLLMNW